MVIMSNIKDSRLKLELDEFCKINNYSLENVDSFADVFLCQDIVADVFLCEIETSDYISLYNSLKVDSGFHLPKTIFIYNGQGECEYDNCYLSSDLLCTKNCFSKLLGFNSALVLERREEEILKRSFKELGLSYLLIGTKYLEMAIKLVFADRKKFANNIDLCLSMVGTIYGKSANAIKKSIYYSINFAVAKNCKAIQSLVELYGKDCITAKQLISYVMSNFLYSNVS